MSYQHQAPPPVYSGKTHQKRITSTPAAFIRAADPYQTLPHHHPQISGGPHRCTHLSFSALLFLFNILATQHSSLAGPGQQPPQPPPPGFVQPAYAAPPYPTGQSRQPQPYGHQPYGHQPYPAQPYGHHQPQPYPNQSEVL